MIHFECFEYKGALLRVLLVLWALWGSRDHNRAPHVHMHLPNATAFGDTLQKCCDLCCATTFGMGVHELFYTSPMWTWQVKVCSHLNQQKQGGERNGNGMDISLQNKLTGWKLCWKTGDQRWLLIARCLMFWVLLGKVLRSVPWLHCTVYTKMHWEVLSLP